MIGKKRAISHVFLNNIFKINDIPKNKTKNKSIETINLGSINDLPLSMDEKSYIVHIQTGDLDLLD